MAEVNCKHGCCKRRFMPLTLSFAATIHRMQGLNVGKSETNDINENLRMILEPGGRSFEMLCPGAAYTAFARATSMGNGNPYDSAIWVMGPNIINERFINMTTYLDKPSEKVKKIIQKEKWIERLESNLIDFIYTKKEKKKLFKWATKKTITQQKYKKILEKRP